MSNMCTQPFPFFFDYHLGQFCDPLSEVIKTGQGGLAQGS